MRTGILNFCFCSAYRFGNLNDVFQVFQLPLPPDDTPLFL